MGQIFNIISYTIDPFTTLLMDLVIDPLLDLFTPDMPDMPDFPGIPDQIPFEAGEELGQRQNTISEGLLTSRCYGTTLIAGNKIRFNEPDATDLRMIVAHCLGSVEGITAWYANDVEWSELTGSHTKTEYKGTFTQTADARFSDRACAYRGRAYTAFTFAKNDQQIGYNPNITVVMQGLKCAPLAGGADVFTRNNAVIMYDWLLNVEGYDAGDLDLNAFKSLEELCDEVPSGGTGARYTFDYNFLQQRPINDDKKLIWQSFNGRTVMSQGKIKPVWNSSQIADGAGGLTAKTVVHAFNEDNIVKDTLVWRQPERPNLVRVHYLDATKNYKTSTVEEKDTEDIALNGVILHEERCNYVTSAEVARRRAKFKFDYFWHADYVVNLSAWTDASDIEVFDLVTVTHSQPGWTAKKFLVTQKGEDAHGRMKVVLSAYYSGVYSDAQLEEQPSYESNLPNPYVAVPVTSVALAEGGFIAGDGSYIPYVTLTFTKPNNSFWLRGQVWVSIDDLTYEFYGHDVTGTGFRIDPTGGLYAEGDTLYIKVLSENTNGVTQTIASASAVSEYIDGKTAAPSNVTGFSVSQIGDIVIFSMNRPSQGTDADFSHFELREGSTWEASQLVAEFSTTKFALTDFIEGSKVYRVKAVDTSANKSATEVIANITLRAASIQNIYYQSEKIDRIGAGSVSQIVREYGFNNLDGGFFIDGTEYMDDDADDYMDDSDTERMWAPGYDSGYIETEAIDTGAEITGQIYLDIVSTGYLGATFSVEYKVSTNGVDYSEYTNFTNGASNTFRYIIFKITLTIDRANYPQNNIEITRLYVTVDLPTIINEYVNQTIDIGGSTITFITPYTTAASIGAELTPLSAAALIPTYDTVTVNNLIAYLFDKDGNDVGGTMGKIKISGY